MSGSRRDNENDNNLDRDDSQPKLSPKRKLTFDRLMPQNIKISGDQPDDKKSKTETTKTKVEEQAEDRIENEEQSENQIEDQEQPKHQPNKKLKL